jgi:hypothetical protein
MNSSDQLLPGDSGKASVTTATTVGKTSDSSILDSLADLVSKNVPNVSINSKDSMEAGYKVVCDITIPYKVNEGQNTSDVKLQNVLLYFKKRNYGYACVTIVPVLKSNRLLYQYFKSSLHRILLRILGFKFYSPKNKRSNTINYKCVKRVADPEKFVNDLSTLLTVLFVIIKSFIHGKLSLEENLVMHFIRDVRKRGFRFARRKLLRLPRDFPRRKSLTMTASIVKSIIDLLNDAGKYLQKAAAVAPKGMVSTGFFEAGKELIEIEDLNSLPQKIMTMGNHFITIGKGTKFPLVASSLQEAGNILFQNNSYESSFKATKTESRDASLGTSHNNTIYTTDHIPVRSRTLISITKAISKILVATRGMRTREIRFNLRKFCSCLKKSLPLLVVVYRLGKINTEVSAGKALFRILTN